MVADPAVVPNPTMLLDGIVPMLAEAGSPLDLHNLAGTHVFDQKLDGLRALLAISESGHVLIRNRNGRDITDKFPEITLFAGEIEGPVLLDGELVCDGGFQDVAARGKARDPLAGAREHPATFVAFDVLVHPKRGDVRHMRYIDRRVALVGLYLDRHRGFDVTLASSDPNLYDVIRSEGGEGVIAKRADASYRKGRSRDWVKIKSLHSVTCIITGFEPGNGSRAHLGALNLAMFDPATRTLVDVGRVGSGLTEPLSWELHGLLTGEAVKPTYVEVQCLGQTRNGRLRQPVFKGLRSDADLAMATTHQMKEIPTA
jgi:bifunctional non-homologous end joining protein LigD